MNRGLCENNVASSPLCRQSGVTATSYHSYGAPFAQVVSILESDASASAPIDDETGLNGTFDIELRWSREGTPQDGLPTLTTAVQEQLGLRLERRKVQREVLVVDRMERASPD